MLLALELLLIGQLAAGRDGAVLRREVLASGPTGVGLAAPAAPRPRAIWRPEVKPSR